MPDPVTRIQADATACDSMPVVGDDGEVLTRLTRLARIVSAPTEEELLMLSTEALSGQTTVRQFLRCLASLAVDGAK